MKSFPRTIGASVAITLVTLSCAYLLERDSGPSAGLVALAIVVLLGLMEVGFSYDSAVLNAKVLGRMSLAWRWSSVAVGLLVAIVGMRFVFPVLLVWAVGDQALGSVVSMVLEDTAEFRRISLEQFILIEGFGGAFLFMAFAHFFLDRRKEDHWIHWLERPMGKLGRLKLASVVATGTVSYLFSCFVPAGQVHVFRSAALLGIVMHLVMDVLSTLVRDNEKETLAEGSRIRGPEPSSTVNLASLLYLVLLGTFVSLGGVVGAFAVTSNSLLILLGLGLGTMLAQCLSLRLIPEILPRTYRYLRHGISWAQGILSLGLYLHAIEFVIPEILIGTVGAGFIGSSYLASLRYGAAR